MSARKARAGVRERFDGWRLAHPALATTLVFLSAAATILVVFLFVLYSGLDSTADFIYNQF